MCSTRGRSTWRSGSSHADEQARYAISLALQTGSLALGLSLLSLRFARIAVSTCTTPLTCSLIAVVRRALAVLGGPRALLGRFPAMLRGTLALLRGRHHDVGAAERRRIIVVLAGAVALCCRQIASVGGLISCRRRQITRVGDLVTRVGAVQSRSSRLITVAAGQRALIGGVLAYILAAVVVAELGRQQRPQWASRIFVGNALTWQPPRTFDFVRVELLYVPDERQRQLLKRLLSEVMAPGGRLIVCGYGSPRSGLAPHPVRRLVRSHGLEPEAEFDRQAPEGGGSILEVAVLRA